MEALSECGKGWKLWVWGEERGAHGIWNKPWHPSTAYQLLVEGIYFLFSLFTFQLNPARATFPSVGLLQLKFCQLPTSLLYFLPSFATATPLLPWTRCQHTPTYLPSQHVTLEPCNNTAPWKAYYLKKITFMLPHQSTQPNQPQNRPVSKYTTNGIMKHSCYTIVNEPWVEILLLDCTWLRVKFERMSCSSWSPREDS